ncbi:MAG: hypothetical protein JNL10_18530 [Verrucomicrobiales bacterium]|nr:hypothetical protein [Verrucomicrobiales bacterium]
MPAPSPLALGVGGTRFILIAQTFLAASDPIFASRTWQTVMDEFIPLADLHHRERLHALHRQAIAKGWLRDCAADALNFYGAAVRARSIPVRDPVGVFVALVQRRQWHHITQAQEDEARRCLNRAAWNHAEWNAEVMRRERQAAMEAGFRSDLFSDSPHALVFPAKELRNRPGTDTRRRRRSGASRWKSSGGGRCDRCGHEPSNPTDRHCFTDRES